MRTNVSEKTPWDQILGSPDANSPFQTNSSCTTRVSWDTVPQTSDTEPLTLFDRDNQPREARLDRTVRAEIAAWREMPAGGGRTGQRLRRLLQTRGEGSRPAQGLLAEARDPRRLLHSGCEIQHEVPTPNGRTCDFEVSFNETRFFLHVKCPKLKLPNRRTLPSFLRMVEQVRRPYLVEVDWRPDLDEHQLSELARAASRFTKEASLGEELLHRDDSGRIAGNVRIAAAVEEERAVVSVASYRVAGIERVGRILERAYDQFMPGGENVILVLTEEAAHDRLVDLALLGTHVERWDKMPRGDRAVAFGRADDGFWSGGRFDRSRVVGWMQLEAEQPETRLWYRSPQAPEVGLRRTIETALGVEHG